MDRNSSTEQLYRQFLDNNMSEEELNEFLTRLQDSQAEAQVDALMQRTWEEMFERQQRQPTAAPLRGKGFFRVAAAAVIIVALGAAAYLVFSPRVQRGELAVQSQEKRFHNDVAPGANHAILTLADGSQLVLDSSPSGSLASEGSVQITKTKEGEIVYNTTHQAVNPSPKTNYNTLVVPRGSKVVNLTLADGSKVWLDAASSIKYPTAFSGRERRVVITGQAYFEVKHNAAQPFVVQANGVEIHDIGTAFNVSAFSDEGSVKTTLVEGSVQVQPANGASALLKPGQQAQVQDNRLSVNSEVNIAEITAWKNGVFRFSDAGIQTIMTQLVRWYDLEVVYEDVPTEHFVSTIPRETSLINAFKILEATGRVHFKIDGKKVTVMK